MPCKFVNGTVHAWCCCSSSHDEFNPRQSSQIKYLSHSLVDLLGHLSPIFRRNFQTLLKKRFVLNGFPFYSVMFIFSVQYVIELGSLYVFFKDYSVSCYIAVVLNPS